MASGKLATMIYIVIISATAETLYFTLPSAYSTAKKKLLCKGIFLDNLKHRVMEN